MKFPKVLFGMAIGALLMVSQLALAQFEGQISMNIYEMDDGERTGTNQLNLYTTSDRILIKGEDKINISDGMMEASGILIRSDVKDFIIMMGEKEALRFTKEELEGMFNMISMFDEDGDMDVETNTNFEYTNEVRSIQGMKATELRVWNEDKEGYLSIWLTNEIDINWGQLTSPWINVPKTMASSVNQMTQEFKSKNFPLLVEVFERKGNYTIFEVTEVKRSRIAKDMVELPPNIQLLSLQTMLMKAMMNK